MRAMGGPVGLWLHRGCPLPAASQRPALPELQLHVQAWPLGDVHCLPPVDPVSPLQPTVPWPGVVLSTVSLL